MLEMGRCCELESVYVLWAFFLFDVSLKYLLGNKKVKNRKHHYCCILDKKEGCLWEQNVIIALVIEM